LAHGGRPETGVAGVFRGAGDDDPGTLLGAGCSPGIDGSPVVSGEAVSLLIPPKHDITKWYHI
jgi:hypothetical protein